MMLAVMLKGSMRKRTATALKQGEEESKLLVQEMLIDIRLEMSVCMVRQSTWARCIQRWTIFSLA